MTDLTPAGGTPRFVPRGRHLFIYDLVAISVAIVGAFALRFDASDVVAAIRPYLPVCLLPLLIQPPVNAAFGLYRREWRYASVREVIGLDVQLELPPYANDMWPKRQGLVLRVE